MTNDPIPNQAKTQNATKTTIADQLRMVSWRNYSHATGVVKSAYECLAFPLTAKPE